MPVIERVYLRGGITGGVRTFPCRRDVISTLCLWRCQLPCVCLDVLENTKLQYARRCLGRVLHRVGRHRHRCLLEALARCAKSKRTNYVAEKFAQLGQARHVMPQLVFDNLFQLVLRRFQAAVDAKGYAT